MSPKERLYFIFNISYIDISAIYSSALLCLYLLTINFITIRFCSSISITIILLILLKSLETVAYCFLNKYLNTSFKSKISLSIISILIIITLFYNAKLQSYILTIFLIMLTSSIL